MSERLHEEAPDNHDGTNANPTRKEVLTASIAYVGSGLSLIPIRADSTKAPAFELLPAVWSDDAGKYTRPWGGYKECPPTWRELRNWFLNSGTDYGMAILAGKVSGNLEIIDLDNWDVVEPWTHRVDQEAPGLLDQLVQVKTPRPGLHVYYRCETIGGCEKLARVPDPEYGNQKPKTLIEVKGEGGYCLAPPSPAACHKSGRCYTFVGDRDFTMLTTITPAEREVMFACARAFNCWDDPKRQPYVAQPHTGAGGRSDRPGDDFNSRADWAKILQPHGWTWIGRGAEGPGSWCRPGKAIGTSATTNFGGSNLLFVFSSNADPFEQGTAYTKFSAYALLNHKGDFRAAARALAAMGYGAATQRRGSCPKPFAKYANYPVSLKRHQE